MENNSTKIFDSKSTDEKYSPPKIEIIDFVIEEGFASSSSDTEDFGEDTW